MSKEINITVFQAGSEKFSFTQILESQNIVFHLSQFYLISTNCITADSKYDNFEINIKNQKNAKFIKINDKDNKKDEYYFITDSNNQDLRKSLIASRHQVNEKYITLIPPNLFTIINKDLKNNSIKKNTFILNNKRIKIPVFSNCSYEQKLIILANNLHIPLNLIKFDKKRTKNTELKVEISKFRVFIYQSNEKIKEYSSSEAERISDIKKWYVKKKNIQNFKRKIRFYCKNYRIPESETIYQFANDRIDVKSDIELTFFFNCKNFFRLKLFLPIDMPFHQINKELLNNLEKIQNDYLNDKKLALYYTKGNEKIKVEENDTIESIEFPHEITILRNIDSDYLEDSIMITIQKLFYYIFVDLWVNLYTKLFNKWDVEDENDIYYQTTDNDDNEDYQTYQNEEQIEQRDNELEEIKERNTKLRLQRQEDQRLKVQNQRLEEENNRKRRDEERRLKQIEDDKRKAEEVRKMKEEEERRKKEAEEKRKRIEERKRKEEEERKRKEAEEKRRKEQELRRKQVEEQKRKEQELLKKKEEEEEIKRLEEEKKNKSQPKSKSYYSNIINNNTQEIIPKDDDDDDNLTNNSIPVKNTNKVSNPKKIKPKITPQNDNDNDNDNLPHDKKEKEDYNNKIKFEPVEPQKKEKKESNIKNHKCKLEITYSGLIRSFIFFSNQKINIIKKRIALAFEIDANNNNNTILKNKNVKLNEDNEIGLYCIDENQPLHLNLETYELDKKKTPVVRIQFFGKNNIANIRYKDGMTISSLKKEIAKKNDVYDSNEISVIYGGANLPDEVLVRNLISDPDRIFLCDLNNDVLDFNE